MGAPVMECNPEVGRQFKRLFGLPLANYCYHSAGPLELAERLGERERQSRQMNS